MTQRLVRKGLRSVVRAYVWLILGFIFLPLLVIISMSFTPERVMQFPPTGFSLQWYQELLTSNAWMTATFNTILVATTAAVLATGIGGTAAFALYRYEYSLKSILAAIFTAPIMLPPVIMGVVFTSFFITLGLGGELWTLIIAHGVFLTPFPFILISLGLTEIDTGYEEAARDLGASRLTTLRTVTLPLLVVHIIAGALFAFVFSLNDFIIAWLMSGFTFETIPIRIFSSLRYSYSPVIAAVSTILIVMTFGTMVVVDYVTDGGSGTQLFG